MKNDLRIPRPGVGDDPRPALRQSPDRPVERANRRGPGLRGGRERPRSARGPVRRLGGHRPRLFRGGRPGALLPAGDRDIRPTEQAAIALGLHLPERQDPQAAPCGVELRSSGGQTVFPPSTHDIGEPIAWTDATPLIEIDEPTLLSAFGRLAAATVLARAWARLRELTRHGARPCGGALPRGVVSRRRPPTHDAGDGARRQLRAAPRSRDPRHLGGPRPAAPGLADARKDLGARWSAARSSAPSSWWPRRHAGSPTRTSAHCQTLGTPSDSLTSTAKIFAMSPACAGWNGTAPAGPRPSSPSG